MSRGIRRYEPGGFYGIIDKCAYDVALDLGVDESVAGSVAEGAVWCGLLWLRRLWSREQTVGERIEEVARTYGPLTKQEEGEIHSSVAIIFLERANGWVDTVWYDDSIEAEEEWVTARCEPR